MADRKSLRYEKPRSRRHEDREREDSLLFSSPLKHYNSSAPLASILLKDGSRELGVYVQERGALDSLVKNPLDWISRSRPAQSGEMNCKKHSLIKAFKGGETKPTTAQSSLTCKSLSASAGF